MPPPSTEELESLLRQHVLASMPAGAKRFLRDEGVFELLFEYRIWRSQHIAPRPRQPHLSRELEESEESIRHHDQLDALVAKIEAGDDLNPHLSGTIQHFRGPKRGDLGTRDLLLAEWGIHHLHLSEELQGDGLIKRDNDVLFAVFDDQNAYLIGIYGHPPEENWAKSKIFAVIVRNWPDAGLVHEMAGIVGLSQDYDDADRLKLRNSGVQSLMEVDGKVYLPKDFGLSTAGTPIHVTRAVNQIAWTLKEWREHPEQCLRESAGISPDGEWKAAILCPEPGFEEYCGFTNGEAFVPLGRIC